MVARAYQVEIDALGPAGPRPPARRADPVRDLHPRSARPRGRGRSAAAELPWTAYIGVVYAARQLASDALDTAAAPDLGALGADLQVWIADLFRIGAEASE